MKLWIDPGVTIEFDYLNWRGVNHHYVVTVESVSYGERGTGDENWYLNAQVVTRDGDPREDIGDNHRRSFLITTIRDPRIVL